MNHMILTMLYGVDQMGCGSTSVVFARTANPGSSFVLGTEEVEGSVTVSFMQ